MQSEQLTKKKRMNCLSIDNQSDCMIQLIWTIYSEEEDSPGGWGGVLPTNDGYLLPDRVMIDLKQGIHIRNIF